MLGYGDANRIEYTVLDANTTTYPITTPFNLTNLSAKSVNIYLNGKKETVFFETKQTSAYDK